MAAVQLGDVWGDMARGIRTVYFTPRKSRGSCGSRQFNAFTTRGRHQVRTIGRYARFARNMERRAARFLTQIW